jgi:hypothetical protein
MEELERRVPPHATGVSLDDEEEDESMDTQAAARAVLRDIEAFLQVDQRTTLRIRLG